MSSRWFDVSAANADTYEPPEFSDEGFNQWAFRIALKMANLRTGASEGAMRRVISSGGLPSPEWAAALLFMMSQSRLKK